MSFAYSTSLATNKDKVRFRIGDTDSNRPKMSDEEIIDMGFDERIIESLDHEALIRNTGVKS